MDEFDLEDLGIDPTPAPPASAGPPRAAASGKEHGKRLRLTLRARWALAIAATFAGAGVLLIGAEYLLVTQVVPTSDGSVVVGGVTVAQDADASADSFPSAEPSSAPTPTPSADSAEVAALRSAVAQAELDYEDAQARLAQYEAQQASLDAADTTQTTLLSDTDPAHDGLLLAVDQARANLASAQTNLQLATNGRVLYEGDVTSVDGQSAQIMANQADGTVTYTVVINDVTARTAGPSTVLDTDVATGLLDAQQAVISNAMSHGLIGWSVALVVAFSALAGLLAWWLAGRGTRRIGVVTALASGITAQNLDRRLDLPGPRDEVKELGDTLNSMLDRVQAAFESQRRFVANASHELRTPLTTARAALEIPLAQGRVPEGLAPAVTTALEANAKSETIITSLLALARSSAGPVAEPRPIPLGDLVAELIAGYESADVTWHAELPDAVAMGEPALVSQAVDNLLRNAVRHNVPHGDIWVRTAANSCDAVLEISNTGIELAKADIDALTEPFFRGPQSRLSAGDNASDGVGLGLSIVAAIAEASDADLELEARDGGGLTARLVFPAPDQDGDGTITAP